MPASSSPRPSVKDVAALAQVSVGTVSNVLNRPEVVSEAVRRRVGEAIERLGYIRNTTAQALRLGSQPVVGVAVLDIDNPFFTAAAAGMEERLRRDGLVMTVSSTHSDPAEEVRLLRLLEGHGVRGVLLTSSDPELFEARRLAGRGVPVVLFDEPGSSPSLSSVCVDDRLGARLAIDHLLGLGHRSIAFVNGPPRLRQSQARLAGVEEARASFAGGSELTVTVHCAEAFTMPAGRRAGQWLADQTAPRPTAVFCANDLLALGVMTALEAAGLGVPGEVSVVGFDDIAIAGQMAVPLTTIRQPMAELGWAAADLLLAGPGQIRHQLFAPELVVRRSTGPAPARS